MAEALEHPWLVGTSSQESDHSLRETQSQRIWNILDEFEEDGNSSLFGDDNNREQWVRPATMSGTNFGGIEDSDTSFSQPMGNLRLGTPGTPARDGIACPSGDRIPQTVRTDQLPSSPPLTPSGLPETVRKESRTEPKSLPTPAPSAILTSVKRKSPGDQSKAMFSSGSLSPPPLDVPASPAKRLRTAKEQGSTKAQVISPRRSNRPRRSARLE